MKRSRSARKEDRARDARARQRGLPRMAAKVSEPLDPSDAGDLPEGNGSVSPRAERAAERPGKIRSLPVGIKLLAVALLVIAALWLVAHFRR